MDFSIFSKEEVVGSTNKFFKYKRFILVGIGLILFMLLYFIFLSPPWGFPTGIISIEEGKTLKQISKTLADNKIIRSQLAFEALVVISGWEKKLIPADYYFENPIPVFEVARRIAKGEHDLATIVVTIPEGFNNLEIAENIALKLPKFNKEAFLVKAKLKEGYLFPDTYFFLYDDTEDEVIKAMNNNYENKISAIRSKIASTGRREQDIITMASIIEREANGEEDRESISGILWKRISIDMPLQADAAPDTYKFKGLPQAPIANPGLEAIEAALNPKPTDYLYYLHDQEGNIYYARNFEEHKINKSKYLNQ